MRRLALLVVVTAILGASCGGTGAGTPAALDDAYGTVAVSSSLPEYVGEPDAAVGMDLPVISGTGLDGEPVAVDRDGSGKIVVLLAHWCSHCQAEVPRLVEWMRSGGVPDGVEVVAVATATTDQRPNFPPGAWLEDEEWQAPVIFDDESYTAGAALGLSAFPFFVFADSEGKVVARATGELDVGTLARVAAGLAPQS